MWTLNGQPLPDRAAGTAPDRACQFSARRSRPRKGPPRPKRRRREDENANPSGYVAGNAQLAGAQGASSDAEYGGFLLGGIAGAACPLRPGAAARDVEAFTGVVLEEYFRLVAETFHKYDRNHMLLGNRFQSGTINNEQLCRLCGKYLDVMSFNYYTYYLDEDFLDRIHGWTGGQADDPQRVLLQLSGRQPAARWGQGP